MRLLILYFGQDTINSLNGPCNVFDNISRTFVKFVCFDLHTYLSVLWLLKNCDVVNPRTGNPF